MVDPENTQARARATRGYNQEGQQKRKQHHPDPAQGGTHGYPLCQRHRALNSLALDQYYQVVAETIGCSEILVWRWEERV